MIELIIKALNEHAERPRRALRVALTQDRLRQVFDYDSRTGDFRFRRSMGGHKAASVAGTVAADGYISISVDSIVYRAHRFAWLYVHGSFPPIHLDHVNRNRRDNRLENLRPATPRETAQNSRRKVAKSGKVGVYPVGARWQAKMGRTHLGVFDTVDEAHGAYLDYKKVVHRFQPTLPCS